MGAVKLSSNLRYPGGKSKMLPLIMEHLDPLLINSKYYIEPFVGGGSVMLHVAANYPNLQLFINDKNYGVASFWSIVTGTDDQKINQLITLIDQKPTVDLYAQLREDKSLDPVMCAYKMLFFNKCNFSGIETSGPIGGTKQESKYKIDCRYNPAKIKQGIKDINQVTRGRVVASNVDINNCFVLWNSDYPAYLDPPYVWKGSELYVNYMEQPEHEQMAKRLASRSNWLLSYDDCPEVRALYAEKEIVNLSVRYSINGKKEAWSAKKELLIKG